MSRRLLLFSIVLTALIPRVLNLEVPIPGLDEGYTLILRDLSFRQVISMAGYEANPPLGTILYKLWALLFGDGLLVAELLSVVCGVLTTVAVFGFVHPRSGARVAYVAAVLLAFSPVHIFISQQIRIYSFALLISVLLADCALSRIETTAVDLSVTGSSGQRNVLARFNSVCLVLYSVVLLWSHYYAALVVLAVWSFLGIESGFLKLWKLLLSVFILSVPVFYWIYCQLYLNPGFDWIQPVSFSALVGAPYFMAFFSYPLCLAYIILGAIGFKSLGAIRYRRLLLLWLCVPFLVPLVISAMGLHCFHFRYMIFCLPPIVSLVAEGSVFVFDSLLASVDGRLRRATVVAVCGLVCLYLHIDGYGQYLSWLMPEAGARKEAVDLASHASRETAILHLSRCSYVQYSTLARFQGEQPEARHYLAPGQGKSNIFRYFLTSSPEIELSGLLRESEICLVNKPCKDRASSSTLRALFKGRHLSFGNTSTGITCYVADRG